MINNGNDVRGDALMETVAVCTRCHEQMEINPISGDLTCFLHGNPEGSAFEKMVWERTNAGTWY